VRLPDFIRCPQEANLFDASENSHEVLAMRVLFGTVFLAAVVLLTNPRIGSRGRRFQARAGLHLPLQTAKRPDRLEDEEGAATPLDAKTEAAGGRFKMVAGVLS